MDSGYVWPVSAYLSVSSPVIFSSVFMDYRLDDTHSTAFHALNPCAAEYKYRNYHGELDARVNRDWNSGIVKTAISGGRSLLLAVVSPFFFYLPNTYMEKIEEVWLDENGNWTASKQLLGLFEESWKESIVPV